MGISFMELFGGVYNRIPEMVNMPFGEVPTGNFTGLLKQIIINMSLIAGPVFLVGVLVAFLSNVVQVKWHPTAKPMQPKLNKINPISGFKRIFSANSVVELVKAIAKIALILYVAWQYIQDKLGILFYLLDMPLLSAIQEVGTIVIDLGIRISAVYMVIALLDLLTRSGNSAMI